MRPDFQKYIMERVSMDGNGCWHWQLTLDRDGYGMGCFEKRKGRSHRLAYEAFVGPIPDGLLIDHLCRVRDCVNPEHLEPVTSGENTRRGITGSKPKTHCKRGHPFAEHGRKTPEGMNQCLVCDRLRSKAAYERNREAILAKHRAVYAAKPDRNPLPCGEAHPSAKVSEVDVRLIRLRAEQGDSCRRISRDYSVSPSTIERIVNRTKWKHVA